MKRKGKSTKTKTVGYGYVGTWRDGTIGWSMPKFVEAYPMSIHSSNHEFSKDSPHYLCKITIELVKDKKGRKITRYSK